MAMSYLPLVSGIVVALVVLAFAAWSGRVLIEDKLALESSIIERI